MSRRLLKFRHRKCEAACSSWRLRQDSGDLPERQETTNMTDRELAEAISRRDDSTEYWQQAQRHFEQLYNRHSRLLLAFLSSRVNRSDLEDIHQAVWSRVWQYLPTHFDGQNFRAWLYQIARNYVIQLGRKKKSDLLGAEEEQALPSRAAGRMTDWSRGNRMEVLQRCLERLEDNLAELVRARLRGESYEDICTTCEIPPARAHKMFHTAKSQLTACVERAMQ